METRRTGSTDVACRDVEALETLDARMTGLSRAKWLAREAGPRLKPRRSRCRGRCCADWTETKRRRLSINHIYLINVRRHEAKQKTRQRFLSPIRKPKINLSFSQTFPVYWSFIFYNLNSSLRCMTQSMACIITDLFNPTIQPHKVPVRCNPGSIIVHSKCTTTPGSSNIC